MESTFNPNAPLPKSLVEAITQLTLRVSDEHKDEIKSLERGDLVLLHHTLGQTCRNEFRMWGGNDDLLKSCEEKRNTFGVVATPGYPLHPDDMSMVIIVAFWYHLNWKENKGGDEAINPEFAEFNETIEEAVAAPDEPPVLSGNEEVLAAVDDEPDEVVPGPGIEDATDEPIEEDLCDVLEECEDNWIDSFITEDGNQFVAWDETQANELGRFDKREDAEDAIKKYAEQISNDALAAAGSKDIGNAPEIEFVDDEVDVKIQPCETVIRKDELEADDEVVEDDKEGASALVDEE